MKHVSMLCLKHSRVFAYEPSLPASCRVRKGAAERPMSNNRDVFILGSLLGVQLRAHRSVLFSVLGVWILNSAIAARVLRLPVRSAATVGLAATAVHWLSTLTHQSGHAFAAYQTGYPMKGTTLWWVM